MEQGRQGLMKKSESSLQGERQRLMEQGGSGLQGARQEVVDAKSVAAPFPTVVVGRKRRKLNGPWRSSRVWLHFYLVPCCVIATAACKHCHKRFLCNPKLQGTSNMLAHSEVCNKNALVIGNDPRQLNHNHLVVID